MKQIIGSFLIFFAFACNVHAEISKKICIIGAGPAGIKAAAILTEKGYKDITVLERNSRLGGKVNTETYSEGSLVEHGPIQVGIGHTHVNADIQKLGLGTFEPHNGYSLRHGRQSNSFNVVLGSEEFTPWNAQWDLFKEDVKLWSILNDINFYEKIGNIPANSEYLMDFSSFTKKHNLERLRRMYSIYISSYGYGATDTIPAFFPLLNFNTGFGMHFWHFWSMNLKMLDKGFSGLLDALVEAWNIPISYNQNVIGIDRTKDGIIVTRADRFTGKKIVEKFDELIIACPIDKIYGAINRPSKIETILNKNIHYNPYHVVIADIPNLPRGGYVLPEYLDNPEHLQLISKNSVDGNLAVLYIPQKGPYHASYIRDFPHRLSSMENTITNLHVDLKKLGLDITKIEATREWNEYFPHFLQPESYKLCEQMQGENNTYYVGTMCAVADYVEEAFKSAVKIVDEHFPGPLSQQSDEGMLAALTWHFSAANRYNKL